MRKIILSLTLMLMSISSFAQHTWDFSNDNCSFYSDSIDVALLNGAPLTCNQIQYLDMTNVYQHHPLNGICVWGIIQYGGASTYKGISIDGLLQIPNFTPETDKLVINYFGWNGSGYALSSNEAPTRISKNLFVIQHNGNIVLVVSIDWYRNGVLITDPSSIVNQVKEVRKAMPKTGKKFNVSGIEVNDSYKGIVIENGQKHVQ